MTQQRKRYVYLYSPRTLVREARPDEQKRDLIFDLTLSEDEPNEVTAPWLEILNPKDVKALGRFFGPIKRAAVARARADLRRGSHLSRHVPDASLSDVTNVERLRCFAWDRDMLEGETLGVLFDLGFFPKDFDDEAFPDGELIGAALRVWEHFYFQAGRGAVNGRTPPKKPSRRDKRRDKRRRGG